METLIAYINSLKNVIPVNFTLFNLQRLKIHWLEFKNFLSLFPQQLVHEKNLLLEQLEQLKIKIDAIPAMYWSKKQARYAYQEAAGQMKSAMEQAILKLQKG
jgi:hypothetical protein